MLYFHASYICTRFPLSQQNLQEWGLAETFSIVRYVNGFTLLYFHSQMQMFHLQELRLKLHVYLYHPAYCAKYIQIKQNWSVFRHKQRQNRIVQEYSDILLSHKWLRLAEKVMRVPFHVQQAKKHLTPLETPPSDFSRLSILENNPELQTEVCVELSENHWSIKPN